MKKVLIIVLIVSVIMCFYACGARQASQDNGSAEPVGDVSVSGGVEELSDGDSEVFSDVQSDDQQASGSPSEDNTATALNSPGNDSDGDNSGSHDAPSPDGSTDYEKYLAMTGEEQEAFYNTFASPDEFFAWLNNARAEYEAMYPGVDIGDGVIDVTDLN